MMSNPDYWEESARTAFVAGRTADAELYVAMATFWRKIQSSPFHRRSAAWFARSAISIPAASKDPS